jgi:hypothetical protein
LNKLTAMVSSYKDNIKVFDLLSVPVHLTLSIGGKILIRVEAT